MGTSAVEVAAYAVNGGGSRSTTTVAHLTKRDPHGECTRTGTGTLGAGELWYFVYRTSVRYPIVVLLPKIQRLTVRLVTYFSKNIPSEFSLQMLTVVLTLTPKQVRGPFTLYLRLCDRLDLL